MKLLFQLFFAFFKIGALTFGGGYAMLPMFKKELVITEAPPKKEEFSGIKTRVERGKVRECLVKETHLGSTLLVLLGCLVFRKAFSPTTHYHYNIG